MSYDVKLTDRQIEDKTTYQFVVEVLVKEIVTKPGTDGYYSDTTTELVKTTSTRDTIVSAVAHAQAVLDLELPKRKPTCRTCHGPVEAPNDQCDKCRASR